MDAVPLKNKNERFLVARISLGIESVLIITYSHSRITSLLIYQNNYISLQHMTKSFKYYIEPKSTDINFIDICLQWWSTNLMTFFNNGWKLLSLNELSSKSIGLYYDTDSMFLLSRKYEKLCEVNQPCMQNTKIKLSVD